MITKVRLKNWKSHADSELSFAAGTNGLVGIVGSGKSLPYEEIILVKKNGWGKFKIGEIVEEAIQKSKNILQKNDTIFTLENPDNIFVQCFNPENFKIENKSVTAFIKHKSPKTLLKVCTKTGRSIIVTKDHSLFKVIKNNIVPCRGSEIKVGDYIPCAKRLHLDGRVDEISLHDVLPDFKNTTQILRGLELQKNGLSFSKATKMIDLKEPHLLSNWKRRKMLREPGLIIGRDTRLAVPEKIKVNNDFAKIAGAFLSEGGCEYNETESRYKIHFTNNDQAYLDDIKECWERTFPNIPHRTYGNILQMNSQIIATLFSRLFGENAGTKFIPNFIYGFDDEVISDFLSKYFEGDGWVVYGEEVACASKSINLIDGLLTILSKWGILTTIHKKTVNNETYYTLSLLSKHIPKFAEYVKFMDKEKQTRLSDIVNEIKNRKRRDEVDIIPHHFIGDLLHSLIIEYHMSTRKNPKMRSISNEFRGVYLGYQNIGKERLRKILKLIFKTYKKKTESFKTLEKIVDSDIFFDKVVEVEEIQSNSEWVYDISVEGLENFVAGIGNIITHNTSILDAICFALFGTFPTLQTRKLKLDDVIMKKPVEKNSAEVEVSFRLNGNDYSVKRIIEKNRGTSYSEIKENGRILESPSTKSVTGCVERILKVNYELFSKAIYSEQNSIDYFLTLGKGQRMKKIDELLMIDRFEKARANAVTLTNKLIDVKLGRQSTVEQLDVDDIKKSIEELKKSIGELEEGKSKLRVKLVEFTKKRISLEREIKELRKMKENLEEFRRNKSAIDSAIKETSEIVTGLEKVLQDADMQTVDIESISNKLDEYSKKIDEMNNFILDKQAVYENLQEQVAESKAKIEFLRKEKISRLEKEVEDKLRLKSEFEHLRDTTGENIDQQLADKQALLERLIGELESTKSKVRELEEVLNKLSAVVGRCPICDSVLSEERKHILITEKRRELEELEQKIKDANSKKQLIEQEIKKLQLAAKKLGEMLLEIKDFDKIKTDLENSKQLFVQQSKTIETLNEELNSLKEEIGIVQKELTTTMDSKQKLEVLFVQMSDYENRKARLEQLKREKEELEKHLTEIERQIAGRDLEKMEDWLRNIIAKEKEAEAKSANFDSLINERTTRISEYEKTLEASQREKREIERLDALIKDLKIFTQALQQTQIELRKEFIEAVNYTMNKLWPTLYPYQDFIGIRLAIEEGDYVLQLQERGMGWVNVEGVVSGGERSIACLALRIAFALVLAPQLRWLVLDEPTHNLDTKAVEDLAQTLRDRINDFVDQVFLITHEERLESAITGNLYRLERDKAKNEATKVIQIN